MQSSFVPLFIAYVDAKVAGAMCKGGVVAYLIDEISRSSMTDSWILKHVVPNMVNHGIDSGLQGLGRAVLCRLFHRSGDDAFPEHT